MRMGSMLEWCSKWGFAQGGMFLFCCLFGWVRDTGVWHQVSNAAPERSCDFVVKLGFLIKQASAV